MIPVRDKKNIPKAKRDLPFPIVLKIHLQFQQALPKCSINSNEVCGCFFAKGISVRDEKSDLRTMIKRCSIHSFKYIFSFQQDFSKTQQQLLENFSIAWPEWIYGKKLDGKFRDNTHMTSMKLLKNPNSHCPSTSKTFPPQLTLDVQF